MTVAFDQVAICNMALSHVGAGLIESIDETGSKPAAQCKLWYDAARLVTLEAYDWSFARTSLPLSLHSTAAPTNRWAFRYQWPSDCVTPRLIENPAGPNADAVPFEPEMGDANTRSIVTDMEQAILIYTRDTNIIPVFSMSFTLLFAMKLGQFINPKLTGKAVISKRLREDFDLAVINAYVADNSSSVPREERDAATIRGRV